MSEEGVAMGDHLEAAGAALEALDAGTLVGLYVDGFVFEDVAAGETISTRDGLSGYFEALFSMPDVRFTDVVFFQCDSRGAGTWVWSGTNQNGETFSVRGASIFALAEGGIQRETVFYDPRPAFG
jgi:hypothetical protein